MLALVVPFRAASSSEVLMTRRSKGQTRTRVHRQTKKPILRWVRRMAEYVEKGRLTEVPRDTRGFYALLKQSGHDSYQVIYVGIATSLRKRLYEHSKWGKKRDEWTHFCAFEVWPNVIEEEVREIEGLLRQIYRKDPEANKFNRQRKMHKLARVKNNKLTTWLPIPD